MRPSWFIVSLAALLAVGCSSIRIGGGGDDRGGGGGGGDGGSGGGGGDSGGGSAGGGSGAVAPAYPGKVTGSVLYRERIMLPPDAEVVVQLIDASLVEAPPVVIAEQRIPTRGKAPPYEFSVVYDPAAIVSERRYQVRAEILVRGSRRFTTETAMPVITRGSPSAVEIVTVAVRQ